MKPKQSLTRPTALLLILCLLLAPIVPALMAGDSADFEITKQRIVTKNCPSLKINDARFGYCNIAFKPGYLYRTRGHWDISSITHEWEWHNISDITRQHYDWSEWEDTPTHPAEMWNLIPKTDRERKYIQKKPAMKCTSPQYYPIENDLNLMITCGSLFVDHEEYISKLDLIVVPCMGCKPQQKIAVIYTANGNRYGTVVDLDRDLIIGA